MSTISIDVDDINIVNKNLKVNQQMVKSVTRSFRSKLLNVITERIETVKKRQAGIIMFETFLRENKEEFYKTLVKAGLLSFLWDDEFGCGIEQSNSTMLALVEDLLKRIDHIKFSNSINYRYRSDPSIEMDFKIKGINKLFRTYFGIYVDHSPSKLWFGLFNGECNYSRFLKVSSIGHIDGESVVNSIKNILIGKNNWIENADDQDLRIYKLFSKEILKEYDLYDNCETDDNPFNKLKVD